MELTAARDEIAMTPPKRHRRPKDPFKGKTPVHMRNALKVIIGALNPYLDERTKL